jgi:hypothetical protein
MERDLAIGVGRGGRRATIENALSDIAGFGLSRSEAVSMAKTMQTIVKRNWEKLCAESGLSVLEIDRLRSCYIACGENIQGA